MSDDEGLPEPSESENWAIQINRWDLDNNTQFQVLILDPDTDEERAAGEGWSLRDAFIELAENLNR